MNESTDAQRDLEPSSAAAPTVPPAATPSAAASATAPAAPAASADGPRWAVPPSGGADRVSTAGSLPVPPSGAADRVSAAGLPPPPPASPPGPLVWGNDPPSAGSTWGSPPPGGYPPYVGGPPVPGAGYPPYAPGPDAAAAGASHQTNPYGNPSVPPPPPPASGGDDGRRRWGPVAIVAVVALGIGSLVGGGVGAAIADRNSKNASPRAVRNVALPNNTQIAKPQSVPAILAKVEPGVVSIHTDLGAGTGMVITPDGQVLTNYHVIQGASSIKVTLFNETAARPATLRGSDRSDDVALLQITGVSALPTVVLGDSDRIQVGDSVVAVGNALDLAGGPSVTDGIVSAKGRSVDPSAPQNLLQTNAAINPGNSGGPLVNADGEVIGMNTLVIQQANAQESAQNLGFAIPVNGIKPLLPELAKGVQRTPPFLGVSPVTLTPSIAQRLGMSFTKGVIIGQPPDGPAAEAGLQQFDVITSFDGHVVADEATLRLLIRAHKPGDQVKVDYLRGGTAATATVTLGTPPAATG